MTVDLAAASDTNAEVEGNDVVADPNNEGVRLGNYAQLSDKVARFPRQREAADEAGDLNRMSKQVALKVQELKRDMEKQMLSNKAANPGSASTARVSAWFPSFLRTNVSRGTGGANPVLSGTTSGYPTTAATDGTQRALTETLFKTVQALAWGIAAAIRSLSSLARPISSLSRHGLATLRRSARWTAARLSAAVDIYVGDFGEVQIVPSRLMRARDLLIVDPARSKSPITRR